jgi:hypothetical protein
MHGSGFEHLQAKFMLENDYWAWVQGQLLHEIEE